MKKILLVFLFLPGILFSQADLLDDGYTEFLRKPLSLTGYLKADGTVPLTAAWDAGTFNFTIGSITSQSVSANEATVDTSSLVTNGDFATNDLTGWTAAAGWSAATGKAVHTAGIGDTTPLVQSIAVTSGIVYQVQCTTSGMTAGTLTMTLGSLEGSEDEAGYNQTTYYTFLATSTGNVNLTFTPTANYDGATDDISVKAVTANTTPLWTLKDSTGTEFAVIRGKAALYNIGLGLNALRYITTGYDNTAFGTYAGQSLSTGFYNTAFGSNALAGNATGHRNTAIGYAALMNGKASKANTGIGAYALQQNTTGNYNTGLGYNALNGNLTGTYNTAVGNRALLYNTSGIYNVAVGAWAGRYIADGATPNTTSDHSVYLGVDAKALADNDDNEIVIGYNAIGRGSNTIKLGNTSITDVYLDGKLNAGNASFSLADSGAITDILVNPTAKASGNFLDLQINDSSKFSVAYDATVNFGKNLYLGATTTLIYGASNSTIKLNIAAQSGAAAKNPLVLSECTFSNTTGASSAVKIAPTYNQVSGNAANSDLLINRTETAIGSGTQRLISAQVGSAEKFGVDNVGAVNSTMINNADSDTDEVDSVVFAGGYGIVIACSTTDGTSAVWKLKGTVFEAIEVDADWTAVKDNGSTYNVYIESGAIKLQNKVGNDKAVKLGYFGI